MFYDTHFASNDGKVRMDTLGNVLVFVEVIITLQASALVLQIHFVCYSTSTAYERTRFIHFERY